MWSLYGGLCSIYSKHITCDVLSSVMWSISSNVSQENWKNTLNATETIKGRREWECIPSSAKQRARKREEKKSHSIQVERPAIVELKRWADQRAFASAYERLARRKQRSSLCLSVGHSTLTHARVEREREWRRERGKRKECASFYRPAMPAFMLVFV